MTHPVEDERTGPAIRASPVREGRFKREFVFLGPRS